MNLVKITPLLVLALCIDGFQFLVSLALSVVAMFPGTAAGCAAGAYVAGEIGCAALGLIGSIPIVNGTLALVTIPIGSALGFAISICISFVFGSMLILFLQIFGMLEKKAALVAYMGEALPGFSMLPAWTALVLRCAYTKIKEEVVGDIVGGVTTIAGGAAFNTSTKTAGSGAQGGVAQQRNSRIQPALQEANTARQDMIERRQTPMQDMRIKPATNPTYVKAA